MSTYSEKLRHPNWQKKRLEILNRDGFKCVMCGDGQSTLHVHHLYYVKGRDPWEYGDDSLATLCESCHEYEHEYTRTADELLLNEFKGIGALTGSIEELAGAISWACWRAQNCSDESNDPPSELRMKSLRMHQGDWSFFCEAVSNVLYGVLRGKREYLREVLACRGHEDESTQKDSDA